MIIPNLVAKYIMDKIKPYIKEEKMDEVESRLKIAIEALLDSNKKNFKVND